MNHLHLAVLLAKLLLAHACTYFELPDSSGNDWVVGRTMELGVFPGVTWETVVYPPGASYSTGHLSGETKHAKYGIVSIESKRVAFMPPISFDGMNEAGLTVSALALRTSQYQQEASANATVWHMFFTRWILSEFTSTREVKAALPSIAVVNGHISQTITGLHYAITDVDGDSIVIEYVNGERKVHKNDVRVLTNDPTYDWQVTNLNSYVNLSPYSPDGNNKAITVSTEEFGMVPASANHGFNLGGLPGDMGPPARFVRTFFLKQYAMLNSPPKTTADTMVLATGLLNNVFLTKGIVAKSGIVDALEDTNYAVLKLPKARKIYIRSYNNMQWRLVDLTKLSYAKEASFIVDDGSLGIKDVTDLLEHPPIVV